MRDARNPDGAQKFMEWWIRKDTQEKFAAHGGLTTHREVIQTDMFKQAAPYNAAYSESIELVNDYWNTPSYDVLLLVSQKYLNAYITGATSLDAKDTLDTIVHEWQPILQKDCR
jgi:multiple sugar transport system substrate-binding protein